jgi:hypothetical protein
MGCIIMHSVDILKRRSDFIGQVNNMLCYFCKLNTSLKNRLFQVLLYVYSSLYVYVCVCVLIVTAKHRLD